MIRFARQAWWRGLRPLGGFADAAVEIGASTIRNGVKALKCKICSSESTYFGSLLILEKYNGKYFCCRQCGFIQTEEPYWLPESYSSAIADMDIGSVHRMVENSAVTEGLILATGRSSGKFVDFGAGYGLLVRAMRDKGYDFYWTDRYCENLFAKQFVAIEGARYDLLTAFEVFEHLNDPLNDIREMLNFSDNILFSTVLVPSPAPKPGEWWYYGNHGQHIALYTKEALEQIAGQLGMYLLTNGRDVHFLSRERLSPQPFAFLTKNTRAAKVVRNVLRRANKVQSLLGRDYESLTGYSA